MQNIARGNSLGAIIPEIVNQIGLREGEEVEISVRSVTDIKRLFGKYPTDSAQKAKNEMRKGWRDDD